MSYLPIILKFVSPNKKTSYNFTKEEGRIDMGDMGERARGKKVGVGGGAKKKCGGIADRVGLR